jgi:hypothetical protein
MNTKGRSIASLSRMQQKPKVGRKVFGDAIFKEEIDWEHVIPELEKHIAKTNSAKAALDTVVRAIGDRDLVLRKLYNFGGGSPELARAVKAAFSQRRKYILKVSHNMREVAGEIEKAHKYLSDMGLVLHSERANTLRSDADFLKRLANTIEKVGAGCVFDLLCVAFGGCAGDQLLRCAIVRVSFSDLPVPMRTQVLPVTSRDRQAHNRQHDEGTCAPKK